MEYIVPKEEFDLNGFYIEITSRCNLKCLHCYNDSGLLKKEIDFLTFKKLIDEFSDKQPNITISGGEPLTHPQIWEMLNYCKNKVSRDSVMITNATLITKDIAKQLTEIGIGIQVSINGINAKQHDAICGEGNYNKTVRGLDYLLEAGNDKIIIRGMISSLNYNNVEEFIIKWGNKTKNVVVSFLSAMGRGKNIKELIDLTPMQKQEILENLHGNADIKMIQENNVNVNIPNAAFSTACPFLIKSEERPPFSPRIDSAGNVFLCQIFEGKEYILGNVNNSMLHEIFESERFENFINFFKLGLGFKKACLKCVYKNTCGKGCIANAASYGSAQEVDGNCELRKAMMYKQLMLSINK